MHPILDQDIGRLAKVCKIIIDNGSCVNAIVADTVKSLGLTPVSHPSPYKVSWINSTSILIKSGAKS